MAPPIRPQVGGSKVSTGSGSIHLGDKPYHKGTFSKWKQKCVSSGHISAKAWKECLEEAADLAYGNLEL